MVALVADDHDAGVVVGHLGDVVLAGRVEAPFEDVAVDEDRSGESAVAAALFDGADVDDQRTGGALALEVFGFDSVEASAGSSEDGFDRASVAAGLGHRGWVSYMRMAVTIPDAAVSAATA